MADNTTLYIIIGIVLLLAFMNANAQPSVTGGPAMSAYLRRRATMPPAFIGVPTESGNPYEQVIVNQRQYIKERKHATLPQYLRAQNLGVLPKYIQQGNPVFNRPSN